MIGFPASPDATAPAFERRRPHPTYALNGMVAAAHPLTVEAGLAALRAGGNAVDAAVAAGLVAAVVMPEMCGLGGDLFAVVHANGEILSLQGSGSAPRHASYDDMLKHSPDDRQMPYQGPLSISVPGMVDAYFQMLERWGTRDFAEVAQYAIAHAGNGFIVHPLGANVLAGAAGQLSDDPAASAVFLPGGHPVRAGERLVQTDLARTLETLAADGPAPFYRGAIAREITTYLASRDGALNMDDFDGHITDVSSPLATRYRDHTVYQTAIPSQGLILLEALNIVAHADLADPLSADSVHTMVEAKKLAYADRLGYVADPAFHHTPLNTILSEDWAWRRFGQIDPARVATNVRAGELQEGDTTSLTVVDGSGMMVSLIQSVSSAFGSGVIGGNTGVVLNNRVGRGFTLERNHPNVYAPGKRTMHTLNCYLVADAQDRAVLVGGTPGGDGQPQWNLQNLVAMLDAGMDVQAAIDAPRWTSWPGTDPISIDNPFQLRVEERFSPEVTTELERRGHHVIRVGPWDGSGSVQIIARDPDSGIMIGGSDPRVEGTVLGF